MVLRLALYLFHNFSQPTYFVFSFLLFKSRKPCHFNIFYCPTFTWVCVLFIFRKYPIYSIKNFTIQKITHPHPLG